jgi:PAB1-binding protein PBP1
LVKGKKVKSIYVTYAAVTATAVASHAVSATTASVSSSVHDNETSLANRNPSADSTLVAAAASDQQVTTSAAANSKIKQTSTAKSDFNESNCHTDMELLAVVKSERQRKQLRKKLQPHAKHPKYQHDFIDW